MTGSVIPLQFLQRRQRQRGAQKCSDQRQCLCAPAAVLRLCRLIVNHGGDLYPTTNRRTIPKHPRLTCSPPYSTGEARPHRLSLNHRRPPYQTGANLQVNRPVKLRPKAFLPLSDLYRGRSIYLKRMHLYNAPFQMRGTLRYQYYPLCLLKSKRWRRSSVKSAAS